MLDEFPCVRLGKKGETLSAFLLFTQKPGIEYFMCPLDIELISHVQETLPTLVSIFSI